MKRCYFCLKPAKYKVINEEGDSIKVCEDCIGAYDNLPILHKNWKKSDYGTAKN